MPIHYEKFYSEKNLVKKYTDLFVPSIHNVIFNGPATIVIWADGVKTVVKCMDTDVYDPEKGLAMAICKRALGDQFKWFFKHFIEEDDKTSTPINDPALANCMKAFEKLAEAIYPL